METIKNVIQLHDLSTHSGIAAKLEQNTLCQKETLIPQAHRRDVIEGLFLRLAAIYGHVWKSLYKHDELLEFNKLEWLDALAPYEESIIDKALQYCLSHWE